MDKDTKDDSSSSDEDISSDIEEETTNERLANASEAKEASTGK